MSNEIFRMLYGKSPDAEELAKLETIDVENLTPKVLREVISRFDRQFYPTPVSVRFGRDELVLFDINGVKVWLDKADPGISGFIFAKGVYEPHLTKFMQENILPGMTVVDIGANVGIFSMLAASIVGDNGRVLAFEPNTENCRMLLLTIAENGFDHNVTLFPMALSDETAPLYFTPCIGTNGSLLPSKDETLFDPNCIVIPAVRLDDMVDGRVDFIKADVEGAEYLALKGGEQLIRDHRPIITVELSFEMSNRVSGINGLDFIRWILDFGYEGTILGKSGKSEPIGDLSTFLDRWGDSPVRIEDIAFVPK